MPNILKQLSDEHEELTKLLETLSEDEGDRAATFEEVYRNQLAHAKAEEQEFYAHVRTLDEEIAAKIDNAFQEHQEVEKLLTKLQKQMKNDEKFAAALEELTENIEHHVEEEETELFPLVEKYMSEDELVELNTKFIKARKAVMEMIEPLGEYAEMTKEELYEEAKAVNIEGRSKMTREELEEELRKK